MLKTGIRAGFSEFERSKIRIGDFYRGVDLFQKSLY